MVIESSGKVADKGSGGNGKSQNAFVQVGAHVHAYHMLCDSMLVA